MRSVLHTVAGRSNNAGASSASSRDRRWICKRWGKAWLAARGERRYRGAVAGCQVTVGQDVSQVIRSVVADRKSGKVEGYPFVVGDFRKGELVWREGNISFPEALDGPRRGVIGVVPEMETDRLILV